MKNKISELAAALLVLLFVYASVVKLVDIPEAQRDFYNQPFPHWLSRNFIWFVPGVELAISICLIVPIWRKVGFYASSVLMGAYTLYVALIMANTFHEIPCSCGGVIKNLTWGQHLILNIVFLSIAVLGILIARGNVSLVGKSSGNEKTKVYVNRT